MTTLLLVCIEYLSSKMLSWKVFLFRQISAGVSSFFPALLQIQGKPLGTVKVTQQTQGAQTTARAQGRSPAQRRRLNTQ